MKLLKSKAAGGRGPVRESAGLDLYKLRPRGSALQQEVFGDRVREQQFQALNMGQAQHCSRHVVVRAQAALLKCKALHCRLKALSFMHGAGLADLQVCFA